MDRKTFLKGAAGAIAAALLPASLQAKRLDKPDRSKWKAFLIAGINQDGVMELEFINNTGQPVSVILGQVAFAGSPHMDLAGVSDGKGNDLAYVNSLLVTQER